VKSDYFPLSLAQLHRQSQPLADGKAISRVLQSEQNCQEKTRKTSSFKLDECP
jgi:hypothetical protein